MRHLARAAIHEAELARQSDLLHLHRGELTARELGQGAPLREERHTHLHLDRPLDGFKAGERDLDIDRGVLHLERAEDALAGRRRIVVRDHRLAAELGQRHLFPPRQRMLRVDQHDQIVVAQRERHQSAFGRQERDHAEIQTALRHLDANLARGDPAHVDLDLGVL